nr:hypothetical protein DM860_011184 [Ipomoea trifida]
MGFASLFHLQIDNLPTRMGYWLDQNYNPRNSTLYLADDIKAMLSCEDGGLWFKRHFIVLACSWFIDTPQNGYVGPHIFHHLVDVDQIKNLNWCDYVLRSLMDSQLTWAKSSKALFTGSLLFFTVYIANYVDKLDLFGKTIVEVIELASKPPAFVRDNEVIKLMHSATQKLLGGGRVTVDSGIQKDVEASCSQDSFWCNSKNIATMDVAILRSEQYLKKFDDMPSFSLGLTPPHGEESNWDNVVNISSQYQDVRAEFTQACSPSSHHQEDEQMEVCEEGAALEERGGGVEVVAEEDVVVEERADGVEMVVEKESSLDERVGGVDIAGEKDVLVDVSVDAVGKGCEKDSLVDKSSVAVAAGEERGVVLLGERSMMDKGKGIIVDDSGKEAEIQMVEKQEVERRSRKITVPLRSPYLVRQINVNQFLTATEKVYQDWLMQNPNANM